MDKFRDTYQKAVQELPRLSVDAEKVMEEFPRQMQRRRKYIVVRGCTAAAVFLLCGVGTVAAKNYHDSMIKVGDGGFTITTMQGTENSKGVLDAASFFKLGGVFSIADAAPEETVPEECQGRVIEYECSEYNSIDEFLEMGDAETVMPELSLFGTEFTWENVLVTERGRHVMIRLSNEEAYFLLIQTDNRRVESYSSSTVFGGESSDERRFTNSQGLSYVMFDTIDEATEERSVHAVISLNGWDLSVTFKGFEEKVIESVLDAMDLTLYFKE